MRWVASFAANNLVLKSYTAKGEGGGEGRIFPKARSIRGHIHGVGGFLQGVCRQLCQIP